MRRAAIPAIAVVLAFSSAPAAFAQSADCVVDAYGQETACPAAVEATTVVTEVLGTKVTNVEATTTSTSGATLPMTGAELSGLALAGVALIGGGTMLVVGGRRRKQQPTN